MPRRTRACRFLAPAAIGLLALGATSCGTATPDRDELVEALRASGLSGEVATCTADALTSTLSTDELTQIAERGPGGGPRDDPDRKDDPYDQLRTALDECRAELPTTTLPPTSTTIDGGAIGDETTIAEGGSTTVVADVDGTGPAADPGSSTSTTNGASFDTLPSTTTP